MTHIAPPEFVQTAEDSKLWTAFACQRQILYTHTQRVMLLRHLKPPWRSLPLPLSVHAHKRLYQRGGKLHVKQPLPLLPAPHMPA